MKNTIVLIVAGLLIVVGLIKPDLSEVFNKPSKPVVNVLDLTKPTDEALLEKANDVVTALKAGPSDRKTDGKRLASLYLDLSTLIELDGENEVVKTTEEIRQANRLAGGMLRLDIKGKYPDLPVKAQALVVAAIGDEVSLLDAQTRSKAVEGFKALAWACNEGSK